MNRREEVVKTWFRLWLTGGDFDPAALFTEDARYIESWGPEYAGREMIARWFRDWHENGKVLQWDAQEFLHDRDTTVVRWYFRCQMKGEEASGFDGLSLIRWSKDEKIAFLQEYASTEKRYCPYKNAESSTKTPL